MNKAEKMIREYLTGVDLTHPDQHAAQIRAQAIESFEHHQVKQLNPEHWRVANPDHGHYSYHIIAPPSAIIIYGDLGEMILRHGATDSLDWVRGSNMSYVLSKARACDRNGVEEFSYCRAMEALIYEIEELETPERDIVSLLETWECSDYAPNMWAAVWVDTMSNVEVPRCQMYTWNAQMMYHAIQWWANAIR